MDNDEKIFLLINEGRLLVDFRTGKVYAPKSNTPQKPIGSINHNGYLRTCINYQDSVFYFLVHRIVWIAANGIPIVGMQIDHKNSVKTDNRLTNLDLVSGRENMERAAQNNLTNGGWRKAKRDIKGRFLPKATGRLLDGVEWNQYPEDGK